MESFTPNKECWYYTRLLTFTLGIGMEVLHNYFEQKILLAMEFYVFLDSYKHCLFHECYPAVRCCECSTGCLVLNLNTGLTKSQFQLLYDSVPPTKMEHYKTGKNNKIIQECLCRMDAKRSNEVDCMDITLMHAIIESCFLKKKKTIHGNPEHLKTIRNTRNFLAHVTSSKISESEYYSKWLETEQAILGIASAVGKYFAKETKRKIEEFKHNDLTMEKIKVIIESNADEIRKNLQTLLETQMKSTTLVTDAKDEIIELLKKYKDELSIDIGKLRFEVMQFARANPFSSEEETCDSQDRSLHMDTASDRSSEKQTAVKEKDVKKCRLEWRLEVPNSWDVTKIKDSLVKFSELLRPWFEIEFVYVGSLVIKTLARKNVICNRDLMRASVHLFLIKVVEVCKINTDVPEIINVTLMIDPEEFEYKGQGTHMFTRIHDSEKLMTKEEKGQDTDMYTRMSVSKSTMTIEEKDNYTGSEEEKLKTEIKLLKKTIDDSKVQFNLAAEARHEEANVPHPECYYCRRAHDRERMGCKIM